MCCICRAFLCVPGDPATNLDALWQDCLAFYRARGIQGHFTRMQLNMFCQPSRPYAKFPRLRGKAYEVRLLGGPLLHVWQEKRNESLLHRQVNFSFPR